MKKYILNLAFVTLTIGSFTFISCSEEKTVESTEEAVETTYYCPMKCEGEKTYSEEGSCPTCEMDLVVVE